MMFLRTLAVVALLALAAPAAAGPVEDAGSDLDRVGVRLSDLETRRQALQADLDGVAARIETLKRKDQNDRSVLPDGSLEGLLRKSQELAGVLAALARDEDGARSEEAAAARRVMTACDGELATLRRPLASGDGAALSRASELTARRDRARSLLPRRTPLSAPIPGVGPTDDPRELHERADLLRDQHDRLISRAAELAGRIAERRQQDQLDRAMGSFIRQGALFDETRRVVVAPSPTALSQSPSGGSSTQAPTPFGAADSFDPGKTMEQGGGTPSTPVITAPAPAPAPAAPIQAFGGDARAPAAAAQPLSEGASTAELETARASVLTEARALESEASRLDARARALGAGK